MADSIVVVDDEPFMVLALRYVLERGGFEVHEAQDGDEALEKAREVRPSLCLCDVKLPKRNGFEVCEAIKTDADLDGTRVVLLSAFQQESAAARGRRAGADDYLTKPFTCAGIVERLREILDSDGTEPPEAAD
jgi:DNA-binding response OmpR family regulator